MTTVYAGGDFTQAGGQAASHLAAIGGASGAAVPGFAPGTTDDAVLALDVDATHVYAGGRFTSLGGSGLAYLARLDRATGSRRHRVGARPRRRGAGRGPSARRRLRRRRLHDHRRRGARQPRGAVADRSGHRHELDPERQSRGQRHRPRRAVRVRRRRIQRDRRHPAPTAGDAAGRRQRTRGRTCCRGGRAGTASCTRSTPGSKASWPAATRCRISTTRRSIRSGAWRSIPAPACPDGRDRRPIRTRPRGAAGCRSTGVRRWPVPSPRSTCSTPDRRRAASDIANGTPVGSDTSLDVNGVPPGQYYLRLRSVSAGGVSVPSDELCSSSGRSAAAARPRRRRTSRCRSPDRRCSSHGVRARRRA